MINSMQTKNIFFCFFGLKHTHTCNEHSLKFSASMNQPVPSYLRATDVFFFELPPF